MTIVCATLNPGKLEEIRELLSDSGWTVESMMDRGVQEQASEEAATFEENALRKSQALTDQLNMWTVGDDSGITIQALNGEPGVRSARWAGENASDDELLAYTLKRLEGVPEAERRASFHCAAALVAPDGQEWVFQGRVDGRLISEPRGVAKSKLVYDRLFIPDGHDKTFAEMSEEEKHTYSHRAQAFRKMKELLFLLSHDDEFSAE
jgi:XTP/dITP diphosphohydrolase